MRLEIAKQFGAVVGGRFNQDGPYSGQRFRTEHLVPRLRRLGVGEKLVVVLDGLLGYPSSFLEEAFGGLVRIEGFTADELRNLLIFEANTSGIKTYEQDIWFFINGGGRGHD